MRHSFLQCMLVAFLLAALCGCATFHRSNDLAEASEPIGLQAPPVPTIAEETVGHEKVLDINVRAEEAAAHAKWAAEDHPVAPRTALAVASEPVPRRHALHRIVRTAHAAQRTQPRAPVAPAVPTVDLQKVLGDQLKELKAAQDENTGLKLLVQRMQTDRTKTSADNARDRAARLGKLQRSQAYAARLTGWLWFLGVFLALALVGAGILMREVRSVKQRLRKIEARPTHAGVIIHFGERTGSGKEWIFEPLHPDDHRPFMVCPLVDTTASGKHEYSIPGTDLVVRGDPDKLYLVEDEIAEHLAVDQMLRFKLGIRLVEPRGFADKEASVALYLARASPARADTSDKRQQHFM